MNDRGFEAAFPVLFFDGTSTMEVGNIYIQPSLTYKMFQSAVSQKIGLSPNQITIYYERSVSTSGKVNRRTPVTSKFNFALILRERNCYFFAVFKRPRRVRYRKNKRSPPNYPLLDCDYASGGYDLAFGDYNSPYASADYLDYARHRQMLMEAEREKFLTTLNLNSSVYSDLDLVSRMSLRGAAISGRETFSDDGVASTGAALVCEVCDRSKMEGKTAPFHSCKCDRILNAAFRSHLGPIARPARTATPAGKGWSPWTGWCPQFQLC